MSTSIDINYQYVVKSEHCLDIKKNVSAHVLFDFLTLYYSHDIYKLSHYLIYAEVPSIFQHRKVHLVLLHQMVLEDNTAAQLCSSLLNTLFMSQANPRTLFLTSR